MDRIQSQAGVALFVALIILLLVSFMGVSAMRGSILGERMAFNTQARELSFQSAETAINGVLAKARTDADLLNDVLAATRQHCITAAQGVTDGACGTTSTFDGRQLLRSAAESSFVRQRVVFDNDSSAVVDYQFKTIGTGDFIATTGLPFINRNLQEWRKLGPPGPFSVQDNAALGINPPATP